MIYGDDVIPVLSPNTIMSLAHRGTLPHLCLDCFYSNKNKFVQLEDTTIKTCSSRMFGCVMCACARCAEVDSSVKSYE